MEMYERIRELRKTYLKMSQTVFGERLGVSRDVIKNIELNTLARPEQKLSLIKLICKEFSVNEDWLLNGNEPKFIEPDTFSIDKFMKQRNATDLEIQIVKAYFELDSGTRQTLLDHFKKAFAAPAASAQEKKAVGEAETEYIKSRSALVRRTEPSASSTTDDGDMDAAVNE